jgi:hypothetical protein
MQVTDLYGLSDTASVTVNINEINVAADWTGLFNAAGFRVTSLNVSEAAAVGTIIGSVSASDENQVSWL